MHWREIQQHSPAAMSDAELFSKPYIWNPQQALPHTSSCCCLRKYKESCCPHDLAHSLVNLPLCFTMARSESQWPLSGSFYHFRLFFLRAGICACSSESSHSVWDTALHMLSGQHRADTYVSSEKQPQLTSVFSNPLWDPRESGRWKEDGRLPGCLSQPLPQPAG